jgi:hypothetical protein
MFQPEPNNQRDGQVPLLATCIQIQATTNNPLAGLHDLSITIADDLKDLDLTTAILQRYDFNLIRSLTF